MRMPILTRSVVAVATLAIGSVALAAVPANAKPSAADTPNGVTRAQVLTAAAGVRAVPLPASSGPFTSGYDPATNRALRAMVNRVCAVDPDGPELSTGSIAAATASGGSAEGVVVSAFLFNTDTVVTGSSTPQGRVCSFGALAATDSRGVLSGTASLSGLPPAALSGDVFTTGPLNSSLGVILEGGGSYDFLPTFSASGTSTVTVDTKVATKKTTKQKKAAKVKYNKQLKSAKKAYKKALDKAGKSKSKKKAAKSAYSKKRSAAKAAYKLAVANFKIVKTSTSAPFNVSAKAAAPTPPQ
jgi:hypothetical protein